MNRQLILITIVVVGVCASFSAFAQQRPYNQVMKEVQATFASLRKDIDANSADAATQDAAKLQGLFKETEAFWAQFKTKDAILHARTALDASAAVEAAAKNKDFKKAQASYGAITKECGLCHFSHREETQTGFIIRP